MRAIVLSLVIVSSAYGQASTSLPFIIEGTLSDQAAGKFAYLYIFPTALQPSLFMSARVTGGAFQFTGNFNQVRGSYNLARLFISDKPGLTKKDYALLVSTDKNHYRDLVLDKEIFIEVKNPVTRSEVEGGDMNEHHNWLNDLKWENILRYDSLRTWYKQGLKKAGTDPLLGKKLRSEYSTLSLELENQRVAEIFSFIRENSASPLAADQLVAIIPVSQKLKRFQMNLEESVSLMPAEWLLSAKGRLASQKVQAGSILRRLEEGSKLPDYIFSDNSDSVAVADLKGKYFLIQFWTSWCSFCREENIYLNKAFAKYKSRGFTILQISLDANQRNWEKALKEDGILWKQVRCRKGWDRFVERTYEIGGVPTNYLVDPKGVIVARNLRGEQLEEKLNEIF